MEEEVRRDTLGRRIRPRVPRSFEIEARKNALAAARFALENRVTREEVAATFHTNISLLSEALILLRYGTETEIADVESGKVGIKKASHVVRARTPGARLMGKSPVKGAEASAMSRDEAAIWASLRPALEALKGMPRPADVARIMRKNGMRTDVVDRNLMAAFGWLTEFSDEWTK